LRVRREMSVILGRRQRPEPDLLVVRADRHRAGADRLPVRRRRSRRISGFPGLRGARSGAKATAVRRGRDPALLAGCARMNQRLPSPLSVDPYRTPTGPLPDPARRQADANWPPSDGRVAARITLGLADDQLPVRPSRPRCPQLPRPQREGNDAGRGGQHTPRPSPTIGIALDPGRFVRSATKEKQPRSDVARPQNLANHCRAVGGLGQHVPARKIAQVFDRVEGRRATAAASGSPPRSRRPAGRTAGIYGTSTPADTRRSPSTAPTTPHPSRRWRHGRPGWAVSPRARQPSPRPTTIRCWQT
jgi:hypothetical protein